MTEIYTYILFMMLKILNVQIDQLESLMHNNILHIKIERNLNEISSLINY